jgi:vacuolar-type H+-ATPase subunit H
MDETKVLRHLLEVEAMAEALVDSAQAEADRRLADGEKLNREHYDQRYAKEVAELDADYQKQLDAVKADYQKQLDAYQTELDTMPVDNSRFMELAGHLLFKD